MEEHLSSGNGKAISPENADRSPLSCRVSATVKEQLTKQAQELGIPLSELVETVLQRGLARSDNGKTVEISETSMDAISDVIASQIGELKATLSQPSNQTPIQESINQETELLQLDQEECDMIKRINAYLKSKGESPIPFKRLMFNAFYNSIPHMAKPFFCGVYYGASHDSIIKAFKIKFTRS